MSGYFFSTEAVKILMVEDSPTDQQLIGRHLSKASPHFQVECEETLDSAIAWLDRTVPDVILLDLNLPDSEGLDTLAGIRKRALSVPVVILSGQHDDQVATEAVGQGAQDYIPKNEISPDFLARSIRYAIERSRRERAEGELRIAGDIQRQLLPTSSPTLAGFDIAGRCDPADYAGGDYFDFFALPDGKLGVVIADVSGHGVPAAMIMSELRAILRTLIKRNSELNVGQHMTALNEILSADLNAERFVTMFFACLDPKNRSLDFSSAGHPSFVLNGDGTFDTVNSKDPPIGVVSTHSFANNSLVLDEDDIFVLFTDGITEAHSNPLEIFGDQRALELIHLHRQEASASILDRLFVDVSAFAGGSSQTDDMTAVLVRPS